MSIKNKIFSSLKILDSKIIIPITKYKSEDPIINFRFDAISSESGPSKKFKKIPLKLTVKRGYNLFGLEKNPGTCINSVDYINLNTALDLSLDVFDGLKLLSGLEVSLGIGGHSYQGDEIQVDPNYLTLNNKIKISGGVKLNDFISIILNYSKKWAYGSHDERNIELLLTSKDREISKDGISLFDKVDLTVKVLSR